MGFTRHLYLLRPEDFDFAQGLFKENSKHLDGENYDLWRDFYEKNFVEEVYLNRSHLRLDDLLRGGKYSGNHDHLEGLKALHGTQFFNHEYSCYITSQETLWVYNFLIEQNFRDKHHFLKLMIKYEFLESNKKKTLSENLDDYVQPNGKDWIKECRIIYKELENIRSLNTSSVKAEKQTLQAEHKYFDSLPYHLRYICDIQYYYEYYLEMENFYEKSAKTMTNYWTFQE